MQLSDHGIRLTDHSIKSRIETLFPTHSFTLILSLTDHSIKSRIETRKVLIVRLTDLINPDLPARPEDNIFLLSAGRQITTGSFHQWQFEFFQMELRR